AAVAVDPGHDLAGDPGLVAAVVARPFLERDGAVGPRRTVVAVHAVELQPARLEQAGQGADHAVVLEVAGPALLGGEHEHRAPPVAVADHGARRAERVRPELGDLPAHAGRRSSAARY